MRLPSPRLPFWNRLRGSRRIIHPSLKRLSRRSISSSRWPAAPPRRRHRASVSAAAGNAVAQAEGGPFARAASPDVPIYGRSPRNRSLKRRRRLTARSWPWTMTTARSTCAADCLCAAPVILCRRVRGPKAHGQTRFLAAISNTLGCANCRFVRVSAPEPNMPRLWYTGLTRKQRKFMRSIGMVQCIHHRKDSAEECKNCNVSRKVNYGWQFTRAVRGDVS